MIDQCLYRIGSKYLIIALRGFTVFLMLVWPFLAFSQTTTVVYDGITGINHISFQNDTVVISGLIMKSPAQKAGIKTML